MNDIKIISDSSCDLPLHLIKEFDLDIVSYYFSPRGDEKYYKENIDMSISEFYRIIREEKTQPKTSMPNISDYLTLFRKSAEQGKDIICICLTSKFSSSFQSANIAKNTLLEEYPESKIEIIDSTQASSCQGLIVQEAVKMKRAACTTDEIVNKLNEIKHSAKILLTVDTLEFLQRGGRIGKISTFVGTLLSIKPIIAMEFGELHPHGKVRGRKNALKKIVEMTKDIIGYNTDEYNYCIIHSDCIKDAEILREKLLHDMKVTLDLPTFEIGTTIGSHIGPTAVGICLVRKYLN